MPLVLFALILGCVTYLVIRRFTTMTNTPVWVLWLVMMTPVLALTLWVLVKGEEPPPDVLTYGLLILCPLLYAVLVLVGATANKDGAKAAIAAEQAEGKTPAQPKPPAKPLTRDEETVLQRCFPWSVYYLQDIEYRPQAMICKGKLKASANEAYAAVQKNVQTSFGDRFLVLLQEGLGGSPFFALVPNPQAKNAAKMPGLSRIQAERIRQMNSPTFRPVLALGLAIATLLTTTFVGAISFAKVPLEALQNDPALLSKGLAYGLSLMLILGVHESGHYWATRRHNLKSTLPYFIPVPFFLGTFGAFIQMRSPIPNRRALFDVGIAGPLAGLVVSLPILFWGLSQSTVVVLGEQSQLFNFESVDPARSALLLIASKLALGDLLVENSAIALHPLAISGSLGLIVTALNLMPVGQLDGGHIVHAMYGQRTAAVVSQVARLLMLALSFVYKDYLLWAILLLFIPAAEPALNDVSELNGIRDFMGLFALLLLILIILPAPPMLQGWLFQ